MGCPTRSIAVSPSARLGIGDRGGGGYGVLSQIHSMDHTSEPYQHIPHGNMVAHCKPCNPRIQRFPTSKVSPTNPYGLLFLKGVQAQLQLSEAFETIYMQLAVALIPFILWQLH